MMTMMMMKKRSVIRWSLSENRLAPRPVQRAKNSNCFLSRAHGSLMPLTMKWRAFLHDKRYTNTVRTSCKPELAVFDWTSIR